MISGNGLGNPVTMLPKYHSLLVPRLGHSSLEFTFVVIASVFWGVGGVDTAGAVVCSTGFVQGIC